MCCGRIASCFLLLGLLLGMTLTLQADGVNETNAKDNKTDGGNLHADVYPFQLKSFEPNAKVYDAPVSEERTACALTWVGAGNGIVPPGAVVGGWNAKDEILYIGRAFHADNLLTGYIRPKQKQIYVAYGGKEYTFKNYQVLVEVRRGFRNMAEDAGNE